MANEENSSSSASEPLLNNRNKSQYRTKTFVKLILKILMWVVFIGWICLFVLLPLEPVYQAVHTWVEGLESYPIFSLTGGAAMIFTAPILVIACLAIPYVVIREDEVENICGGEKEKPLSKYPRLRLWTFPILVEGPFGVVSAAELIGISLVAVYVVWAMCVYTVRNLGAVLMSPSKDKWAAMLEYTGLSLGLMGLYCTALLFLPVARGSILLRLIDIPFEHAVRYHIWLGFLTVLLFTFHGLCYIIAWSMQDALQYLLSWENTGVAILPGVIDYFVMLLMLVTSLYPVRKKQFELFFYTHQLYMAFFVLLALHVGGLSFTAVAGSIFLFMLDRFLRFWQSKKTVNVISSKYFPCGIVEMILLKPASLQYNALGFIFLKIKEVSWMQWHPFSVSSSPLDGKTHLSILVKNSGNWSAKLSKHVSDTSSEGEQDELSFQARASLTTSVEGPYGHGYPYHLTYENLILVAGGVGISPFLAILRDILHRTREGKFCLPRNILLIWAVRKYAELPLLSTLDMESICPSFHDKLNLEIRIFVTRESEPPMEEGNIYDATNYSISHVRNGHGISVLAGTGNPVWSSTYIVVSIVGFIVMICLIGMFCVTPLGIESWWCKGLLLIFCMVASVVVFGGPVVFLWHLWGRGESVSGECEEAKKLKQSTVGTRSSPSQRCSRASISYGSRPDFKEIFGSISERWGNVDVGVIVCGPISLQYTVAAECRSQNMKRESLHPIFHFNSHSFDL